MLNKNKNKGMSLVELLVAVSILTILTAVLIPSFLHLQKGTKIDKDCIKFDSICVAFKSAFSDPEVRDDIYSISEGEDLTVVCYVAENGFIDFGAGTIIDNEDPNDTQILNDTKFWNYAKQSVGPNYTVESQGFCDTYLVFHITPKTPTTTAKCEYEITATYPTFGQEEGE